MAALTPAVSSDWLNIDAKANSGTGTTPYVPDNSAEAPVKVPYVQTGVPVQAPVVAGVSGAFLPQPASWTGNWPDVNCSQGEFGRQRHGAGSPGYLGEQQWIPAERPTPSRRALTAQAPIGGQLPPVAYTSAGQNNIAYAAPAPPPVTSAPPQGSVVDPLSGAWA